MESVLEKRNTHPREKNASAGIGYMRTQERTVDFLFIFCGAKESAAENYGKVISVEK